jgi:hypothetical protein
MLTKTVFSISLHMTLAVLVITGAAVAKAGQSPQATVAGDLPELPPLANYGGPPERVREAYEFAANHPEVLDNAPCYCACGKEEGHKSNTDCFVSSRDSRGKVTWNAHGAHCWICVNVALEAKRMYMDGQAAAAIQAALDRKYLPNAVYRTPTPTPASR